MTNNAYDYDWPFRCDICDLPCASARGIKIHKCKAHRNDNDQSFTGTMAEAAAKEEKIKQQQSTRAVVNCDGNPLTNVFLTVYLGSTFTADGEQDKDVKTRIAMAMQRCGQLRHVLGSKHLPLYLRLRLYEAAVISILSYGNESWDINAKTRLSLVGANSRMLAWFTGKTIAQEARPATTSLNVISRIRARRLRWVGHLLRLGPEYPPYHALKVQHDMNKEGNILMDAPPHDTFEELTTIAEDRALWRERVNTIRES